MRVPIDRGSDIPLYRQIVDFLRKQLQSGGLRPDTKLPSSRELATALGVSRMVVSAAYEELEAQGLIYSRRSSGTYVARPVVNQTEDHFMSAQDWPAWQHELPRHTWQPSYRQLAEHLDAVSRPDVISFVARRSREEPWPVDGFRKALQSVLSHDGVIAAYQVEYEGGCEDGYLPLRTTIAEILGCEGIPTNTDHVLITNGSQQALNLVARVLLHPGDAILVESPTYNLAIDLFRSLDLRLIGVPVDEDGMRTDMVERVLQSARPRLIYTMPTFQNPTGTCMNLERRRQLVFLAHQHNVPILEDDFVGHLRYEGRPVPALKALDPGGNILYMGTFSRSVMPGLRVGFLIAEGPVMKYLRAYKYLSDLTTSRLLQCALNEFITVGRYYTQQRRLCQVYRRRRDAMLSALDRYFPPGARWSSPKGGRFVWLQLHEGLSAIDLLEVAAEEGVIFMPGSWFFPGKRPRSHLRLDFAMNPPGVIDEGIRRLGKAVRILLDRVSLDGACGS